MIRIAASTPYSPFCQKKVEAANNTGAIIKQNPSTFFQAEKILLIVPVSNFLHYTLIVENVFIVRRSHSAIPFYLIR